MGGLNGLLHGFLCSRLGGIALSIRTPPPPCASTALSKHTDPSDRRFSDRSFRFPLMGTALSKYADPSDRRFPDVRRPCARGQE